MGKLDNDSIAALLRKHGISPTSQRVKIAGLMLSCMEHLSADQIMLSVNRRKAEASKATVYNTLKLFVKKGLVREVIIDPSRILYDPNTSTHHHFYDVVTGELQDIDASELSILNLPQLPEDRILEGLDIIIRTRPATV
jgi:Fur family iron response transcriptional regulator